MWGKEGEAHFPYVRVHVEGAGRNLCLVEMFPSFPIIHPFLLSDAAAFVRSSSPDMIYSSAVRAYVPTGSTLFPPKYLDQVELVQLHVARSSSNGISSLIKRWVHIKAR